MHSVIRSGNLYIVNFVVVIVVVQGKERGGGIYIYLLLDPASSSFPRFRLLKSSSNPRFTRANKSLYLLSKISSAS